MSKEEQDKKVNEGISEVAEAKQTGELSEQDLGKVAGGLKGTSKTMGDFNLQNRFS